MHRLPLWLAGVVCWSAAAWSAAFALDQPPLAIAPLTSDQARDIQARWARHLGKDLVHINSLGMRLVLLPPGEFTMGRTEAQFDQFLAILDRAPERRKLRAGFITWSMLMMPAHRVRITKPFYLGATEVTVGQFRQFAEATGYKTEAEQGLNLGVPYQGSHPLSTWRRPMAWRKPPYMQQEDEPVLHLCWNDCVAFCRWLSEKEGVEYVLPTEADWEYACRAGTTTPWHFGDFEDVKRVAHEYAHWSEGAQGKPEGPRPVGLGKPNAFGLYDMHGNVWEYVADWWHELYYKESPINDPSGPAVEHERGDLRRIIRGGSFDWDSGGGDSAYRMRITQRSTQHSHVGFRVALRIKGVRGVPPAVDPDEARRRRTKDPGADSDPVKAVLKTGTTTPEPPKDLAIDLGNGAKMAFVLIPAGSFLMGSHKGPKDERPVHRVVISKPFYMAKFELTQGQWEAVMGKDARLAHLVKLWDGNPHTLGPNKVMVGLSWNDCQEFIAALEKKVAPLLRGANPPLAKRWGCHFALPTEAQWEYACRAGSATEFSFGNDESQLDAYAWFEGNMVWPGKHGNAKRAAYPTVGQKKPNAWGLYDMHGGVWEWCADWYDPDYYLASPLVDPQGPASGRFKVLRGGSWFRYARFARSAYRRFFHPEQTDYVTAHIQDYGCRLVINLDESEDVRGKAAACEPQAPAGATSVEKRDRKRPWMNLARSLVRHPDNPVLTMGKPGAWDDQTLGCFSVMHDGKKFYCYFEGARFGRPKHIGVATSQDGIHWVKYGKNPLFPGAMPSAIKVGDMFRLYSPGADRGRQGLLMRTSRDGFHWGEPQFVLEGNILDPCVVRVAENQFYLYYCSGGRVTKEGKQAWQFRLYLASSPDGIRWTKRPDPILPLGAQGSWDESSHAGPAVLKLEDEYHLWYLGSGSLKGRTAWRIGHATSPDGRNWTKSATNPVLDIGKPGDWDGGTFMSFDIIFREGKLLFWYAADPGKHGDETKMTIQIGCGASQ